MSATAAEGAKVASCAQCCRQRDKLGSFNWKIEYILDHNAVNVHAQSSDNASLVKIFSFSKFASIDAVVKHPFNEKNDEKVLKRKEALISQIYIQML